MIKEHLQRIRDGAKDVYHLHNLSPWIEKNIYVDGKLMSMHGKYSFQADIVNDTSRVNNTVKPAQIGLTTTTIAYYLAAMATQSPFNTIYSLPTASDAIKLTTTKINPILYGSPRLKTLLNVNVDSTELKQVANNFLFIRGSKSETAALSVSADCLVADEIDRSDPDTLKQFRSRLQASQLAIIRQFSTPTIAGIGISKEAEVSRRYRHMGCCTHCGYKWLPSYHQDIIVPGYTDSLENLNKFNIKDVRWQEARWNCPSCNRDPRLNPRTLEWVIENPLDNYEAHTYYVTPVTACQILTPAYLVRTSTEFNKRSEWLNQVLGETSEEENDQITYADIDRSLVQADLNSSEMHFLGADIGQLCTVTIGRMTSNGVMLVVHREYVPISSFIARRLELIRQFRVVASVHDAFPETHMITQITDQDPNAYGCMFTTTKSTELFTISRKEEDKEEGKINLALVKCNRTLGLDSVRDLFKSNNIFLQKGQEDTKLFSHLLSLKRTQVFQKDELTYVYQKTDGEDHTYFALLYLYLATRLVGTVSGRNAEVFSLVRKFKQVDFSELKAETAG